MWPEYLSEEQPCSYAVGDFWLPMIVTVSLVLERQQKCMKTVYKKKYGKGWWKYHMTKKGRQHILLHGKFY